MMATDFDINKPASSPAFFFHLGDVIYYDNTDRVITSSFTSLTNDIPAKSCDSRQS